MRRPHHLTALSLLAVCTLAFAACGSDDGDDAIPQSGGTGDSAAGTFPVDVEAANGTVTIDEAPERIVSLSASLTEMLYAIGAGEQVVAVDAYSNHPEGTPMTDLSGFKPNVEAVAGYDPDLVVVNFDGNDIVAGLERVGIPVLELPSAATLDDAYDQMIDLGAATGHPDEAEQLVDDLTADIDDLVDQVADRGERLTYYHELDDQLHTATSDTFIGEVYALAGLENVADPADDGSGYPQLSPEFLLDANPDLIFLADGDAGVDAEAVAARPGWDQIAAVRNGDIVELDPGVSSRWGPRVVDFLQAVVKATADVG